MLTYFVSSNEVKA